MSPLMDAPFMTRSIVPSAELMPTLPLVHCHILKADGEIHPRWKKDLNTTELIQSSLYPPSLSQLPDTVL
jgi:hypothetical protein